MWSYSQWQKPSRISKNLLPSHSQPSKAAASAEYHCDCLSITKASSAAKPEVWSSLTIASVGCGQWSAASGQAIYNSDGK